MSPPRKIPCVLSVMAAAILALASCRSPAGPFVRYAVSDHAVTVTAAVTPFDQSTRARESFLHWFKRGFETGLAGKAPLMIDWTDTPEGKAGRQGYDFGLEQGAALREQKTPGPSSGTVLIPPGKT